jgi:hypothetical protein
VTDILFSTAILIALVAAGWTWFGVWKWLDRRRERTAREAELTRYLDD